MSLHYKQVWGEPKDFIKKILLFIMKTLILFLFILFCSNTFSQSDLPETGKSTEIKLLSLEDCIKTALENNHKIKAAKYGVEIARAQKKQAESGYYPQINFNASASINDQDPLFIMPAFQMELPAIPIPGLNLNLGAIDVPQQNVKLLDKKNAHGSIELIYPIYTGGKIQALNEQAKNGIVVANQDYKKSDLDVEFETTKYYYAAVLTKNLFEIGKEALGRMEGTLTITENMYKNGSGSTTKLDYLKNKLMVDQVRTIVTELKKNIKTTKDALIFTLGGENNFELKTDSIPFDSSEFELDAIMSKAYSNNTDWAKVNAAMLAYQAKIDEAKSNHLPSLALFAKFDQNFNPYKYGIVNKDNNTMWTVGVGMQLSIFNGFRTTNEVNEAESQLKKLDEQKNLLHDGIIFQIKDALNKLDITKQNVNNTLQAQITATENCSLNERAFNQDMVEAKDFIESQIIESLMKAQYQKALYDHIEAQALVNYIVGKQLILIK